MLPRRLERLPRYELAGGLVVVEATAWRSRLLGLAWLKSLPPNHALLLARCRSIHTLGMRFAIDVAFLDAHGRVVAVEPALPPRRVVGEFGAEAVLETPAGEVERFLAAGAGLVVTSGLSRPSPRAAAAES